MAHKETIICPVRISVLLVKVDHSIARFHLVHKRLYHLFWTNAILIHDHIANGHFSDFMDRDLLCFSKVWDIEDEGRNIFLEAPCDGILCIVKY